MSLKYEDLFSRPEKRIELIGGEAYVLPNQMPRNLNVQRVLGGKLGDFFQDGEGGGPADWWVFIEPDTRFSAEVLQPDLAGWKKERLQYPNQRPIPMVPDWVCEVVSESNIRHDYVTKMGIYREHKVPYYWIINPQLEVQSIEVFSPNPEGWLLRGVYTIEDTEARIPPFESLPLNVSKFFFPRSAYPKNKP